MTATTTGDFVDSTSKASIETQLTSLGVTSSEVIVIPVGNSNKVYLGKVVIT